MADFQLGIESQEHNRANFFFAVLANGGFQEHACNGVIASCHHQLGGDVVVIDFGGKQSGADDCLGFGEVTAVDKIDEAVVNIEIGGGNFHIRNHTLDIDQRQIGIGFAHKSHQKRRFGLDFFSGIDGRRSMAESGQQAFLSRLKLALTVFRECCAVMGDREHQ